MLKYFCRASCIALLMAAFFTTGSTTVAQERPLVELHTNMGVIVLELRPDRAPLTVDNFLTHVSRSEYDGTIFHRVIKDFMIQGGAYTPDLAIRNSILQPVPLEDMNGLSNVRGTITLARIHGDQLSGNRQWFINVIENTRLDYSLERRGYAVFGRVVSGMDVVDKIARVRTSRKGEHKDVPRKPIIIEYAIWRNQYNSSQVRNPRIPATHST